MIALLLSAALAEDAAAGDTAAIAEEISGSIMLTVSGPVDDPHELSGPLPLADELSWTVGKKSYALDLSAELVEGRADVDGQLWLVKGDKKKKIVGALDVEKLREDRDAEVETSVPAPRGYVNDEGVPVADWTLVARWSSGWDAPARDPEAPEGWSEATFVLLGPGAELHADRRTKVGALGEGLLPLELLDEEGEWLTVKPVPAAQAEQHCQAPAGPLSALDVPFLVKKDALARVAPSALSASFDDGTVVELRAGVGVLPGDDGPRVATRGLRFPVALEGWSDRYTVEAPFAEPEAPKLRLYPRTDLVLARLNGEQVTADSTFTAYPVRGKEGQRYTVGNACVELTVVTPGAAPTAAEKSFTKDPPKKAKPMPSATAADGVTVYWGSGGEAGTVTGTLELFSEVSTKRGKRCVEAGLSEGGEPLELCFAPGDLSK